MNKQTLEDLIKFCEQRNLTEVAVGLKQDMQAKQSNSQDMQERILQIIRKAVKNDEAKKQREEVLQTGVKRGSAQPNQQHFSFNKEETEEVMEKLMGKIVSKPNLIADDSLNAKIEKIFNVEAFQRMVEHADIMQDLSSVNNTNFLNQSEFMQKSFKKVLPTHSQLQDEDEDMAGQEEEVPHFGAQNPIRDDINQSFSQILGGSKPQQASQMRKAEDELDSAMLMPVETDAKKNNGQSISNKRKSLGGEQFEKMVSQHSGKMPSMIQPVNTNEGFDNTQEQISSSFFNGLMQNTQSFIYAPDEVHVQNKEGADEYADDDDPGFDMYVVNEENFIASCKELAQLNNFPARGIKPDTKDQMVHRERYRKLFQDAHQVENSTASKKKTSLVKKQGAPQSPERKAEKPSKQSSIAADDELAAAQSIVEESKHEESMQQDDDEDGRKASVLPRWIKFPISNDEFYPAEFDGVIYDCYNMRVVFDREKTGFEETKDFPIVINSIIAGRYQVVEYLGSAAFSKAIQCYDIHSEQMVCMKIIENNKDYFDQSVDEIKLLRYISANCENLDDKNLLKLFDYFYHKEHLFIVTELLRDNLYEYGKYNREVEKKTYFNVGRLQRITKQILTALDFIHSLRLIHCDLKPENILIKSYSRCEVKVIDFGSSCFIHDHLSSYVQSRSYRAPEVILGCRYDYKIDMWSLGCILAELLTGYVLFQNDSIQGLLARVVGIIGPIPEYMMKEGRLVSNFFTREGLIYQEAGNSGDDDHSESSRANQAKQPKKKRAGDDQDLKIHILVPKKTTLKARTQCDDAYFLDFVRWLLEIDPTKRPSAKEAMQHPWLTECVYDLE